MKPWHKLMFAVILFSVPFLSSPKKLAAACYLDTHCDFYNDDAYTDWCGDEDLCVGCSTTNQASGCHTAYRWCQVYGAWSAQLLPVCRGRLLQLQLPLVAKSCRLDYFDLGDVCRRTQRSARGLVVQSIAVANLLSGICQPRACFPWIDSPMSRSLPRRQHSS